VSAKTPITVASRLPRRAARSKARRTYGATSSFHGVDLRRDCRPIDGDRARGCLRAAVAALTFETVREAIESANSASYGLSASVRRRDVYCDRRCPVDGPAPSGSTLFIDGTPELHFGGYHQSRVGRELGRNAGKDYTEEKTFHVHRGRRTSWLLTRAA
jgi:aldehyde dehydrogenase family protein